MNENVKKIEEISDEELLHVSGGTSTIPLPNGAIPGICPDCGGMLRKATESSSACLLCGSCGYRQAL